MVFPLPVINIRLFVEEVYTFRLSKAEDHSANGNENAPEAGAPEILTDEMIEAGALALASLRDDLEDGGITLREAARTLYTAMRLASASGSSPISPLKWSLSVSASDYRGTFLQPHR